jgi:hypothetical protein
VDGALTGLTTLTGDGQGGRTDPTCSQIPPRSRPLKAGFQQQFPVAGQPYLEPSDFRHTPTRPGGDPAWGLGWSRGEWTAVRIEEAACRWRMSTLSRLTTLTAGGLNIWRDEPCGSGAGDA